MSGQNQFLLYTAPDGAVKVEVFFKDETVWLTQKALAELFGVKVPAINKHLKNIFESGELIREATVSKMEIVRAEGDREVARDMEFYNLEAIIAVGYRVNSYQATRFRIWATKTLREFIIKGFVLDDERLKQGKQVFGKDCRSELQIYHYGTMIAQFLPFRETANAYIQNGSNPLPRDETVVKVKWLIRLVIVVVSRVFFMIGRGVVELVISAYKAEFLGQLCRKPMVIPFAVAADSRRDVEIAKYDGWLLRKKRRIRIKAIPHGVHVGRRLLSPYCEQVELKCPRDSCWQEIPRFRDFLLVRY